MKKVESLLGYQNELSGASLETNFEELGVFFALHSSCGSMAVGQDTTAECILRTTNDAVSG